MPARRCSQCGTSFPEHGYLNCPRCDVRTSYFANATPISKDEARSIASHAKFDKIYAERDAERERKGEPSPEEIGRQQARALIELERQFAE